MRMTRLVSLTLAALTGLAFATRGRADDPKPLATADHPTGLTVEVLEVKLDEMQNKLKVTWRYHNPTRAKIRVVEPTGSFAVRNPPYKAFFDEINYRVGDLSAGEAARYGVVRTASGTYYDATDIRRLGIEVPAGGTYTMYAKFPKPMVKAGHIHLQLPDLPQFENLPITPSKAAN